MNIDDFFSSFLKYLPIPGLSRGKREMRISGLKNRFWIPDYLEKVLDIQTVVREKNGRPSNFLAHSLFFTKALTTEVRVFAWFHKPQKVTSRSGVTGTQTDSLQNRYRFLIDKTVLKIWAKSDKIRMLSFVIENGTIARTDERTYRRTVRQTNIPTRFSKTFFLDVFRGPQTESGFLSNSITIW